jgi:dimethylhistidine N-methyltransferase
MSNTATVHRGGALHASSKRSAGARGAGDLRTEIVAGLSQPQKTLPCKLFYDEMGSQLFDKICDLPEYYPTRTELQIMRDHIGEMVAAMGPRPLIVEYGSGSSLKTRLLLDRLPCAAGYVPIDISASHLKQAARSLAAAYPRLPIHPIITDYTRPFQLPSLSAGAGSQVVAYFPGSTIGNFEPEQGLDFLKVIRTTCGPKCGLLIGVDLKKDPATLHAAYNDGAQVTAAFNLNLLRHINREIGADFNLDEFAHYAFYEPTQGRMEMHLVSRKAQAVDLGQGAQAVFDEGESIHTESCHKYTLRDFELIAEEAGYSRVAVWTDPHRWFSVQYFRGVG